MPATLEQRIKRLEDIEAIRLLVGRYAHGADRNNDPQIMGALLADDAVWEAPGFGRYEGRDEITRQLARIGREEILWSLHYMVSPVIEVAPSGQSSRCHWYLWELAKMPGGDGAQSHWIGGCYHSELIETAAGWRFSHVLLNLKLNSRYSEGWQSQPSTTQKTPTEN
jgi:hypothetical protein